MEPRALKSQNIVSVIISTYNNESTIDATLRSLERQTADRGLYEVIVVDDGSQDGTKSVIHGHIADAKMALFYAYQPNAGVGIARNHGVGISVGKYLAFTDADCICDPDWIETIWNRLVIRKEKFIGGYTYSDDTVIFPWKMAPVLQTGITANLAVDFSLIE
jgi:glycosyltransferase involved in cell wall biosynthesis